MSLEISEYEMIERYVDGLNKAASRAREFVTAEEQRKPLLFVEFTDGLKAAAGSAHQLAHAQSNPNFLGIRDVLEKVIGGAQGLITCGPKSNGSWMVIKQSLEEMAVRGRKMATSKALTRQEVLDVLDVRQIELNKTLN